MNATFGGKFDLLTFEPRTDIVSMVLHPLGLPVIQSDVGHVDALFSARVSPSLRTCTCCCGSSRVSWASRPAA
jgi:hypothetical protein